MAKVLIPTPLRQFTAKQDSVEASGSTVGEVLTSLTSQYPDIKRNLFTDEGKLRSFVNVYLNDEDIRYLQKENTPVKPGDSLSIVPSVAGGAPTSAEATVGMSTAAARDAADGAAVGGVFDRQIVAAGRGHPAAADEAF